MDRYDALEKEFIDYSQRVLSEQAEEIQKKYGENKAINRSLRLSTFNEHLDILKVLLHERVNDILLRCIDDAGETKDQLALRLNRHCENCIQQFLKKDFYIRV